MTKYNARRYFVVEPDKNGFVEFGTLYQAVDAAMKWKDDTNILCRMFAGSRRIDCEIPRSEVATMIDTYRVEIAKLRFMQA